MTQPANADRPTPQRIMEIVWGFAPPIMLEAAVKHRIFDHLDAGPKTVDELTAVTGTSPRGLRALLNGLVGLNFLARAGERYATTPESSAFLVTSKPAFQGGLLRHVSDQLIAKWVHLPEIVRTGRPAAGVNEQSHGAEFFARFVEDLFAMNHAAARTLADHLAPRLEGQREVKVIDVAAGAGVWGIAIGQRVEQAQVTAVDWPGVTPVARRVAAKHGLADRFSTIDGDIATADFGRGYHVATLGHILHSEGVDRSKHLLKKTFDALAPGGTVAIAEFVPDADRTGPPGPLIFAVNMVVATEHGDTFTFGEMSAWLTEAGFVDPRQLPAPAPSPLLLATKPA